MFLKMYMNSLCLFLSSFNFYLCNMHLCIHIHVYILVNFDILVCHMIIHVESIFGFDSMIFNRGMPLEKN